MARLDAERFQVGLNSPLDIDWLRRRLPGDGAVSLREITSGTCCAGLWGPKARDMLQPLSTTDLSPKVLGYFKGVETFVGNAPAPRCDCPMWANWAGSSTPRPTSGACCGTRCGRPGRHTACSRRARMDKGYFIGRDALTGRSPETVTRRLACLTIADPHSVVLGSEPVFAGGRPAGYVTSAAYGYPTGLNIAYAWLPAEVAVRS